ncbi:hypothetical protein P7K49_021338 [Saguinus oedipus]|uniref:Uncharacterized protein n=1 Tax=Saguinus oedipus TaxID=9490 RepID=A0ABQ9UTA4_SAGOE|nr:hypothetical protein P7K49_021338 [Saguinus oedipus]
MEEGPLVGGLPSPEDAMVTELFNAGSLFVSENIGPKAPAKHEEDEFHVFKDAYLGPADPKEPLLHAFSAALGADCQGQVEAELPGADGDGGELLGEYGGIPELSALEDVALLSAPPPPTCNVHFLSSLLPPHCSSAVLPLGAWVREGAAHPGVRVFPCTGKGGEEGGASTVLRGAIELTSPPSLLQGQRSSSEPFSDGLKLVFSASYRNNPEEATFQNLLAQESCCKFPSSQEPEDTSCCSHKKDSNPMWWSEDRAKEALGHGYLIPKLPPNGQTAVEKDRRRSTRTHLRKRFWEFLLPFSISKEHVSVE